MLRSLISESNLRLIWCGEKMENEAAEKINIPQTLRFDLGTFEGFNFRDQSAIERELTAEEVVNWNHDGDGEAEF